MKKVLLYWNHICVLHNEEKKYLERVKNALVEKGIDLEVKYFGLGYSEHMCEYLAKDDCIKPDIIISSDLEVFEYKKIFSSLGELHNAENWKKTKPALESLKRSETMLPFVAIPLVYYTTDKSDCENKTLEDMSKKKSFSFGGINNSAGKTLTKLAWEKYGKQACTNFLDNSIIGDMPIIAFQNVRMKKATTALVPTLYALRADNENTFMVTPTEGTVLIPSYFCARKSIDEATARIICDAVLSLELCDTYTNNGDLLICFDDYSCDVTKPYYQKFTAISQNFIDKLDDEQYYDLYTSKIKTAHKF